MYKERDSQSSDKHTKEDDKMNNTMERPCSVRESVIESCKEIKLMQEGKLPKRTWDNFAKKIREEIKKEENNK